MTKATSSVLRRMSISRSEFFRTLADALGIEDPVVDTDRVVLEAPGRRLEIRFRAEPPLSIASLTLPSSVIELHFEGYDGADVAAALRRFDLYFQRGGG